MSASGGASEAGEETYPIDLPEPYNLGGGNLLSYFKCQVNADGESRTEPMLLYHPICVSTAEVETLTMFCELGEKANEKPFTISVVREDEVIPAKMQLQDYFKAAKHLRPQQPPKLVRLCLCPQSRVLYMAHAIDDLIISMCPFEEIPHVSSAPTTASPLSLAGGTFGASSSLSRGIPTSHSGVTPPATAVTSDTDDDPSAAEASPPRNSGSSSVVVAPGGAPQPPSHKYRIVIEHRGDGWARFYDCHRSATSFRNFPCLFNCS